MSIATSGENAPGNRSSLPDISAARNPARFSATDFLANSIASENATFVPHRASQASGWQRDGEFGKLGRLQFRQLQRSAQEPVAFLLGNQTFGEGSELPHVVVARERPGPQRMRVSHADFVTESAAVSEGDFHAAPERFLIWVGRMVTSRPLRIFDGFDSVPKLDDLRMLHDFRRVALHVMPEAGVQRSREDKHQTVVERLTAGARVVFLRIVRAAAN